MRILRLCHLTSGPGADESTKTLFQLLTRLDQQFFDAEVIALTDMGPLGDEIRALGIPVRNLGRRSRWMNPRAIVQLTQHLHLHRPDVIQTWMHDANLVGGMAARLAGQIPVIWGRHYACLDPQPQSVLSRWTDRLYRRLSQHLAKAIVCGSDTSRRTHVERGYADDSIRVIPHGIDLERFHPSAKAREDVRRELGLPQDAILIGHTSRFCPQQDHRTFLQAAALLHMQNPDVNFLLSGADVTWDNQALYGWLHAGDLLSHCHLLGPRQDRPRLTAALDLFTSSSVDEAFSHGIGEAMACGVPCVATDVGDAAHIIGETGQVVSPSQPHLITHAWCDLLEAGIEARRALGRAARQRISQFHNLSTMVNRYERFYWQVAGVEIDDDHRRERENARRSAA